MTHPFRFTASMPSLSRGIDRWRADLQSLEGLGYSGVAISDHVIGGWSMEPLTTLAAAAVSTTTLRLITLVLSNDYRNPALVHRAIATIDVLSNGRCELGLGAGWWREEYAALGIPFEAGAVRVERLEESVAVLKALFRNEPVTLSGRYYRFAGLVGLPPTGQGPRPPILIGGGDRRILSLAGREADVAGVNPVLRRAKAGDGRRIAPFDNGSIGTSVRTVREAARAAGRPVGEPRLQLSLLAYDIYERGRGRVTGRSSLAPSEWGDLTPLRGVPGILVGSVDACCDQLCEWRQVHGFSDIHIGSNAVAFDGIVERLSGH